MTEKERGIQQTSSFVVFLTEHDLLSMFIDDANNIFIVSNALERLKSKYISINLYTLALAYILTYNFVVCITKAWVINLSTYIHSCNRYCIWLCNCRHYTYSERFDEEKTGRKVCQK